MKAIVPALLLGILAGCATGPMPPAKLGPAEAKALATALDGRVPGTPVTCVSAINGRNLRAIGNNTLIYQFSRKTVYRNDLMGACNGLSMGDPMVMTVTNNQYCRGDIARVVNVQSGMMTGSCALGEFVPYTRPEDAKKP